MLERIVKKIRLIYTCPQNSYVFLCCYIKRIKQDSSNASKSRHGFSLFWLTKISIGIFGIILDCHKCTKSVYVIQFFENFKIHGKNILNTRCTHSFLVQVLLQVFLALLKWPGIMLGMQSEIIMDYRMQCPRLVCLI
jgi:hypothetical protein